MIKLTENNLVLATTDRFYDVETDIYEDEDGEMYMTSEQLGECLGYAQGRKSVTNLTNKYDYLKEEEFSTVIKMVTVDGKNRYIRLFTEDGIYEVTMLAKTDKAREFRCWVRNLIKSLRKGELQLKSNNITFSKEFIEAIIKKYLPVPKVNQFALNTWKKHIAKPLIDELSELTGKSKKECYQLVYNLMERRFGFCSATALIEFQDKYGVDEVSVIDTIAETPQQQSRFTNCANMLIEKYQSQKNDYVPTYAKLTIEDKFDIAVNKVAEFLNDNSDRKNHTLRKIYSLMHTDRGWKMLMSKYRKQTKRSVIEEQPTQKRKFIMACNQIIEG